MNSTGDPRAIDVAAGLVFRDGRLLITRRPDGKHLAGLWEFPGGKLEAGEPWEAALVRELREELDVEVEVGEFIDEVLHRYPGKNVRLRFYRCRLPGGEPRAVECAGLAWVLPGDLDRYEFPPADARLLATLVSRPDLWTA